jgi:zinc protease
MVLETAEATLARHQRGPTCRRLRCQCRCLPHISMVGAVTRAQADAIAERCAPASSGYGSLPAQPPVPEVAQLLEAKQIVIPFDAARAQVLMR